MISFHSETAGINEGSNTGNIWFIMAENIKEGFRSTCGMGQRVIHEEKTSLLKFVPRESAHTDIN